MNDRKEDDDGAGIHSKHKDGEGNEVSEKQTYLRSLNTISQS